MRGRDNAMEKTNQIQNLNYCVEQDVNSISYVPEATLTADYTQSLGK